jgi:hypothetical protein
MDNPELSQTDFTPLKKADKPKVQELDKTKYLDDLYSTTWLNEYFNSKDLSKTSE